jgi:N-acetylglucosamine-6-sulfatase
VSGGGHPTRVHTAKASGRPNVVLIQTDDQTLRQFNRRVMPRTTALLARHGVTFTDYLATTALCCPSRASLITGEYAHNHGVLSNGPGYLTLEDKTNVLPVWLQQAGYNTIHLGKFMNGYSGAVDRPTDVAPGWNDWQTLFNKAEDYYDYKLSNNGREVDFGEAPHDYVTRVLTRKAVRAVRQYAPYPAPFYMQLDERAPHVAETNLPGRCGGKVRYPEPDPRDADRFGHASLPHPPSFNEKRIGDKPGFLRGEKRFTRSKRKRAREHWRCALASLVGADRSVARVYNAVKRAGELGNTVFMFISDNGQFFGEHRIGTGKVLPYEEALQLPLVIRVPRRYRDGTSVPRSVGKPVANIDLAPTILALAHGQPCPPEGGCRTMDGRSLLPLLTGSGNWPRRRALLTEYRTDNPTRYGTCNFAGIRTSRTIYVEHYSAFDSATGKCEPTHQVERYNLRRDPFELRNLCHGGSPASCPGGKSQRRLRRHLQRLRRCAGIKGRDEPIDSRPFCG